MRFNPHWDALAWAFLPTLVPLVTGYLVAWRGMPVAALRRVAQVILLPALLFSILSGPIPLRTFLIGAGVGVAMSVVGLWLVKLWSRLTLAELDPAAAYPNVALFALPFLAMSWGAKGLSLRVAAAVFVGVSLTRLLAESGQRGMLAVLREPWLYAGALAFAMQFFGVSFEWPNRGLGALATAAYPMLMLTLGAMLHPLSGVFEKQVWLAMLTRFGCGFGIVFLAHTVLQLPRSAYEVLLVVALAPPANTLVALIGEAPEVGPSRNMVTTGTVASLIAMAALFIVLA